MFPQSTIFLQVSKSFQVSTPLVLQPFTIHDENDVCERRCAPTPTCPLALEEIAVALSSQVNTDVSQNTEEGTIDHKDDGRDPLPDR